MNRIFQGFESNTCRKNAAVLVESRIGLADKRRGTVTYQIGLLLVFAVLGFLIYSNTLNSPFIFDDEKIIQEDPHIHLTELTLRNILSAAFKSTDAHSPIANISFALNYYFDQYSVIGYHLTNIIIHVLTCIFLYLFIKNTLFIPFLRRRYSNYKHIAFFGAVLWLVHPIQTQSVTYIVQRMNSIAAMFYILSLLLYVKGRLANRHQRKGWPWFAGCIVSSILALGSKEIAATLPVFILLYEWYFFQDLSLRWLKRYSVYVIGVFVILGILGLMYLGANPLERIMSQYDKREFTMTERLLTQHRVVVYYVSLLFYPHPNRLNLDHDFAISHSLISPVTTLPCIVAVCGLVGLAIYISKKERLLSFCILWFFGNLLIESSVIGLELMFEHRVYLPSMLVCVAFTALVWRYIKQGWTRLAAFCFVIVLFSLWTYQRNSIWSDPVILWKDCAAKSPQKPRPHNNLGRALMEQGKSDEAINHYRQALQLDPYYADAHYNLGIVLSAQNKLNEAISHYRQALLVKHDFAKAHNNLGIALGRQNKLDEAISHFQQALQAEPDHADTHYNLGKALQLQGKLDEAISHYRQALQVRTEHVEAHNNLGTTLQSQGKLDEAIIHYRQALYIKHDYADAHNNLGQALTLQGKFDEAIMYFNKALKLKPDFAQAHGNLGYALQCKGKFDEAVKHYTESVRLKPDIPDTMNNLSWLLATHEQAEFYNPDEAIRLAEQACNLTDYEKPGFLDTLAAAYAAAGRFSQAIETAEKALKLAQPAEQKQLMEQIRERLRLYKTGKPYVEPLTKPSSD